MTNQKMMDISYNFSNNFLGDTIKYSADFGSILDAFKDSFPNIDKLQVNVIELPYFKIGRDDTESIALSKDNKLLTINLTFHRYYDTKGNPYSSPSPYEVFEQTKRVMRIAIDRLTD